MLEFKARNYDHCSKKLDQHYRIFGHRTANAATIYLLHLIQSDQTLTADNLGNPFIAIANYFFDCLPQDAFVIQDSQLYESLITLTTHHPTPDLTTPNLIDHLDITITDQEITPDYYDHPYFNTLLTDYQTTLTDTTLLFPCGPLHCLQQLHQFAQGRLLLFSADKGYSRLEDLLDRPRPDLNQFFLMVNYHAIGQYAQHLGGT